MKKKVINICSFLAVLLFAMAPFVMSLEEESLTVEALGARTLPAIVAGYAGIIRWGLLAVLTLFSLLLVFGKGNFIISPPVLLFSAFYWVQFLYALVEGVDFQRFFLLGTFSLLIPPVIGGVFFHKPRLLRVCVFLVSVFLLISLLLNGHLILSGQRFFGFMNNANTYGISTVFWMAVLLLADRQQLITKRVFYLLFVGLILTMIFSGSRNAMVGMGLLIVLHYGRSLGQFVLVALVGIVVIMISSYFIDFSFVSNRLSNLTDSYHDSGRSDIWQRAYGAIETNLWWGNGMNANQVIADTGNMHNCYIRFVLNMGLFFTLIALTFYGASIYKSFKNRSVPTVMTAFLVVYALMNFGEDYFVGLGSATFIYLLFIFGFINYFFYIKYAPNR